MGIFGKKRKDDLSEFHNENLFNDDDDILMPLSQRHSHNVGQNNITAPHAITADELLGNQHIENIPMEHSMPNSVYKQMKEREQRNFENKASDDNYVPSWASSVNEIKSSAEIEKAEIKLQNPEIKEPFVAQAIKKEPIHTAISSESEKPVSNDAFLERCRVAVQKASGEDISASPTNDVIEPVTANDHRSRSVDELVQMLRGKAESDAKPSAEDDTVATETNNTSSNLKVEVEVISMDSDSDIMHTTMPRSIESDVRVYGKIVKGSVVQQTPNGDIESSNFVKSAPKVTQDTIIAEDKTIMFGDLGDIISRRAEDDMNSSSLKFYENSDSQDDDSYDDDEYDEVSYYETQDPLLSNIEDYKTLNDAAHLRVKLSAEKSTHKTLTVFSIIATAILLIIATPLTSSLSAATLSLIELILLIATVVVNFDIFKDFKYLVKMRPRFDSCVGITSIVMLAQCTISSFVYGGQYRGFAIGTVILLTINRIAHLLKATRVLQGLEFITNSEKKRAVISVEGERAKTISSGAIDGEALVLCDRPAVNIKDYLKNCGYFSPFDLKIRILLICAVALAAVIGIISGAFGGLGLGITVTAALLTCMFPAAAALICELPMYLASKKASDLGAMLAGYKGAYELNLANLVAVSSSDLFPVGSVKLYNMKTLAENEIGKTLMDAAAVAIAAKSPLSAIFTDIIGNVEKTHLPKVNGVQYEDKMGISGWIGERTILIGNRNLMQGHNITVPPAAVDQKILRAGYFPVYIAVGGVPCLLFIIQYETDENVAKHLQSLCDAGMTVVVDPKDPNTTSAMICDYFGLPNDALRIMNHNSRITYEHTAAETESISSSAAFKNICGFFSAICSSIRLNSTYRILTAVFIIALGLGALILGYLALTSKLNLINSLTIAGFQLLFTVISFIIAKVRSSN